MTWKKIGGVSDLPTERIWTPENETVLEGIFIGKKEKTGQMQSPMFVFKVKNENVGVWGSTVLETKLAELQENDKVKIEYLGLVKGKTGRQYKDFDVSVWTDEEF